MTTKSIYYESLQGDVRKRYDEKTSLINEDPYMIAKGEFSKDGGEWPDITNMDIIQFLAYKESGYSHDQLKNYKSLDAYKFFQDGWVHEILHKQINGLHLFRAKVHHSMRIREKPLDTWLIINADGSIESAHCTCMAGLQECCRHVGAVLFALETSSRIRQEATVIDVGQSFKRIREMDFQSESKKMCTEDMDFGCAPPTPRNIPSPTERERNSFYQKLYQVLPNSGILSLTKQFASKFKPKSASVQFVKTKEGGSLRRERLEEDSQGERERGSGERDGRASKVQRQKRPRERKGDVRKKRRKQEAAREQEARQISK